MVLPALIFNEQSGLDGRTTRQEEPGGLKCSLALDGNTDAGTPRSIPGKYPQENLWVRNQDCYAACPVRLSLRHNALASKQLGRNGTLRVDHDPRFHKWPRRLH